MIGNGGAQSHLCICYDAKFVETLQRDAATLRGITHIIHKELSWPVSRSIPSKWQCHHDAKRQAGGAG